VRGADRKGYPDRLGWAGVRRGVGLALPRVLVWRQSFCVCWGRTWGAIVLEWSRQGFPAVNDVLAHYSKLAPKMTTPRKGDYPHYRDSQLGEACCIDPLVGQYKANRAGLGNLLRREHIRTALRAVLRYNFQRTLNQHYNYGRTYATGDEGGVVTGTYPRGGKPSLPFPYQSECWGRGWSMVCLRTPASGLRLQTRGVAGRASHSCPTR
jgi:hypothetical protein